MEYAWFVDMVKGRQIALHRYVSFFRKLSLSFLYT